MQKKVPRAGPAGGHGASDQSPRTIVGMNASIMALLLNVSTVWDEERGEIEGGMIQPSLGELTPSPRLWCTRWRTRRLENHAGRVASLKPEIGRRGEFLQKVAKGAKVWIGGEREF